MRAGQRRSRVAAAVAVVALGVGAFGIAGCGGDSADLPEGTAARVGDTPITQAALDRQIEQSVAAFESQGQAAPAEDSEQYQQLVQQSMQTLVQQKIITAEAAECGEPCKVTKDEITEELQSIIATEFNDSQKEFNEFLDERKLSRADARVIVENSLLQQKLFDNVTRGVRFTEEDAKAYYEENSEQFSTPAGRKASHILVATKAEADAIRARVNEGNFAAIAREESTDTGSATQGGDLGIIQKGQLVPEFEKVAFALKDGEISAPVETQFGWHIITVGLVPASTTPFAEAKDGIMQSQLQQKRQETYSEWAETALADWEERTVYASDDLKPPAETETAAVEDAPAP
ncbi:MAG: peptidylprolyl isomerase [Thermoleophilia bacterium]